MTSHIVDTSQRKAARVAGLMSLFCLIVPLLNWGLGRHRQTAPRRSREDGSGDIPETTCRMGWTGERCPLSERTLRIG